VGTLVALGMVRFRFPGSSALQLLFLSPMLIPAIVFGLAAYEMTFALGMVRNIPVLFAVHVVGSLPFPIRTVTAVLRNFDRSLEEAATNLGASPWRTFFTITLPLLRSGITAGLVLAFVMSWNEFSTSLFLAPKSFLPLPLQIASYLRYDFEPLLSALATVMILFSGLLVIVLDRTIGISNAMGSGTTVG